MVALRTSASNNPGSRVAPAPRRRVEVVDDLRAIESEWRQLEASDGLFTPYQLFDLQAAWLYEIAKHGFKACITIVRNVDGKLAAILPLIIQRRSGMSVARYFGGTHTSYNMPLMTRCFASSATRRDIDHILQAIHRARPEIDIVSLERQPTHWEGVANPFAKLPGQPSTNPCPMMALEPGLSGAQHLSSSFRRRLNTKERKLIALPGYKKVTPTTIDGINELVDAFFAIKRERMAEQKLPDIFGDPDVASFIRRACTTMQPSGRPTIQLHALTSDEEVIAIFACVSNAERASMMFNTYTTSQHAKHSPGLILTRDLIDHYVGLGCTSLDLGIGEASYKRLFCKFDEDLKDSFMPLSMRGRLGAGALSALTRAKRIVKRTPALADMAQRIRHAFNKKH